MIYRSKEITPEQSSLLERLNFAQYPTEQELSDNKDTRNLPHANALDKKERWKDFEKSYKGSKNFGILPLSLLSEVRWLKFHKLQRHNEYKDADCNKHGLLTMGQETEVLF